MRILVTGAGGMIGRAVLERLVATGRDVVGLDGVEPPADAAAAWEVADITDAAAVGATVAEAAPSHVLHCAAISGPMVAPDDPGRVFRVNVDGTRNVLEASRAAGVSRLVFTSSIMAYGAQRPDGRVDELAPLLAREAYGASKAAAEALVRAYAGVSRFTATSLRLAMVYGPRRATSCLIGESLRAARRGAAHRVDFGRGWARQYIYLDDVVDAVLATLDADGLPGDAYNVAPGCAYPLEEVAETLDAAGGARLVLAGEGHPFDPKLGVLDVTAAERDLGFRPRVSLAAGIRAYADWLSAHPF